MNATGVVREALRGSGIELVASCAASAYDSAAPPSVRSPAMLSGARGMIVAGSAGPALFRAFRAHIDADPRRGAEPHPYDVFVASILARADAAIAAAGHAFRRFDATFHASPRIDFVALARLTGLGSPGPFFLAIHTVHGPWWALRGAWLVDGEVDPPLSHAPPCDGCLAPCVGGWQNAGGIAGATPEARSRCVVGQGSRYDDEQIAFHYGR